MDHWLTKDTLIHLPRLFEYLGYQLLRSEETYLLFEKSGKHRIIILTEKGYFYYTVQRPQEKLSASDLITTHVSKMEGAKEELIWDKVAKYYDEVVKIKSLLVANNPDPELKKVEMNFNHFHSYRKPLEESSKMELYQIAHMGPFTERIFLSEERDPLFPLFNLQNDICGYFHDMGTEVVPYRESAIGHSLWYSNIPKKIEGLFLFSNPKEALAFHKKFRLENVVYLALGTLNYKTTNILFQIQRITKVDKLYLSFTGQRKIEGYLRDLQLLTYLQGSELRLTHTDRTLMVRFPMGSDRSFTRLYDHIRSYNKALAKRMLEYNKVLNQNLLNKFSIVVSKDNGDLRVRLPIESQAIKVFVWSYYKNYLNKTVDILKPRSANWHADWENSCNQVNERKEVPLKEYRIAL
ncbi:hypothetical protein [Arenibacter amylolyticus]|uniref:hypothetical protein n=1 Tax=Arenibacter amylolyticus TaxID=1406873 RepID=UPI001120C17D|nr:hypothetical protein [Arenibacter amylolyticus]